MKKQILGLSVLLGALSVFAQSGNSADLKGITLNGKLFDKTGEVLVKGAKVFGKQSNGWSNYAFPENRNVTISSFIMAKYEVTQELYEAVMKKQDVTVDGKKYRLSINPSLCYEGSIYSLTEGDVPELLPVEFVTWYDAVYFCNALSEKVGLQKAYNIEVKKVSSDHIYDADVSLVKGANGYRLPTEAEWEFASRGGDQNLPEWDYYFSGSNTVGGYSKWMDKGFDKVGWYWFNCLDGITRKAAHSKKEGEPGLCTHEVGKKSPNALGIYDMSGNVWEWCYDKSEDLFKNLEAGEYTNPTGPESGQYRVIRGWAWNDTLSMTNKLCPQPNNIQKCTPTGIRLVRSAQ